MKAKSTVIAMAFIALPCTAYSASDSGVLSRFSIGIGVASVGSDVTASAGGVSGTVGETSTVGLIDLAYTFPAYQKFGVGIGGTYDFNKTKAGEVTDGTDTFSLSGKDHYSFYVQPYYAFNTQTAVFAKLGYNSIKGEAELSGMSDSTTFQGIGYGLGLKTFVDPHLFVEVEASWVDYNNKDISGLNIKPKSHSGIFTIGYKF